MDAEPLGRGELGAKRGAGGPAEATATGANGGVGDAAGYLHEHRGRIGHGFVENHVVIVKQLSQLRRQVMWIDGAGFAFVSRELCRARNAILARRFDALQTRRHGLFEAR